MSIELYLWMLTLVFWLIVMFLLILVLRRLPRKRIVVPNLTVKVDKASYLHGDTVQISGQLIEAGSPVTSETVSTKVTDPNGNATSLPDTQTDTNGAFSNSWVVPSDAASGTWTVEVTALGVTATTSFTLGSHHRRTRMSIAA